MKVEAKTKASAKAKAKAKASAKAPATFRQISLQIEEGLFQHLMGELGLKMVMGNFFGESDELLAIIVKSMDKGDAAVKVGRKAGT